MAELRCRRLAAAWIGVLCFAAADAATANPGVIDNAVSTTRDTGATQQAVALARPVQLRERTRGFHLGMCELGSSPACRPRYLVRRVVCRLGRYAFTMVGLRNPLAGIRALADYGLRHDDPAVWRAQLHAIQERESHASHLVAQLLALAFADEAKETIALSRIDLRQVVETCLAAAIEQMDTRHVDFSAEGLDKAVMVWGNEALVSSALTNLLDNALRYGRPADGERPRITVSLQAADAAGKVCLSVSDNGPGLDSALADTRQRWSRGAGVEQVRGGTGLGLAIVTRYAEILEAELDLQNQRDGGLRASLVFRSAADPTSQKEMTT